MASSHTSTPTTLALLTTLNTASNNLIDNLYSQILVLQSQISALQTTVASIQTRLTTLQSQVSNTLELK
jgi:prefoldin subunit 5